MKLYLIISMASLSGGYTRYDKKIISITNLDLLTLIQLPGALQHYNIFKTIISIPTINTPICLNVSSLGPIS